jgi:hypothetical protein
MASLLYLVIGFIAVVLPTLSGAWNSLEPGEVDFLSASKAATSSVVPSFDNSPTLCGAITENTILSPQAGPYVVTCPISIGSGVTVTVTPGTILKFSFGTALWVTGVLDVQGTELAEVYFTSLKDDIGGDTNGDGTVTAPAPASWQNTPEWGGIVVHGTGTVTMTHAHVLYGSNNLWGSVDYQYSGIVLAENAHATLTDSSIRYSIYGIKMVASQVSQISQLEAVRVALSDDIYGLTTGNFGGSYAVSIFDSVIRNNHTGLVFQGKGSYQISQSRIDHNSHTGLLNTNPFYLDARNNWWGHTNGPLTKDNPNLYGEFVRGLVTVHPWLTDSSDGSPDNLMQPIQATPGGTTVLATWISSNTIWTKAGSPYVVRGDLVFDNADLFVLPGVVIKLEPEGKITPWFGSLNLLGTAAEPIVVTSIKDDTVAGDTNGDGDASQPQSGDWYGLYVTGSALLQHVEVRYAGRLHATSGAAAGAALYAGYPEAHNRLVLDHAIFRTNVNAVYLATNAVASLDYLKVIDSVFEDNQNTGIWVQGDTGGTDFHYIQVTGSVFRSNATGVLYNSNGNVQIGESFFELNSNAGLNNQGSQAVDARNNWWNDPSGPFHATLNPYGLGDTAAGNTLLVPWLAAEQSSTPGATLPLVGTQILGNPSWEAGEDPQLLGAWQWEGTNSPDDCFAWTFNVGDLAGPPADGNRFLVTHRRGGVTCASLYQDVERFPQPGEIYTFEIAARAPDDLPAHARRFDLQLFAHDGADNVQAGERKSFTVLQNQWSRHRVSITINDAAYRYLRAEVYLTSVDTEDVNYNFDDAKLVGPAAFRIAGRVFNSNREPIEQATVNLYALSGKLLQQTTTVSDGAFEIKYVSEGRYRVTSLMTPHSFTPSTCPGTIEGGSCVITLADDTRGVFFASNISDPGRANILTSNWAIDYSQTRTRSSLRGDGQETVLVHAQIRDGAGNALAGRHIVPQLRYSLGDIKVIGDIPATDSQGATSFRIASAAWFSFDFSLHVIEDGVLLPEKTILVDPVDEASTEFVLSKLALCMESVLGNDGTVYSSRRFLAPLDSVVPHADSFASQADKVDLNREANGLVTAYFKAGTMYLVDLNWREWRDFLNLQDTFDPLKWYEGIDTPRGYIEFGETMIDMAVARSDYPQGPFRNFFYPLISREVSDKWQEWTTMYEQYRASSPILTASEAGVYLRDVRSKQRANGILLDGLQMSADRIEAANRRYQEMPTFMLLIRALQIIAAPAEGYLLRGVPVLSGPLEMIEGDLNYTVNVEIPIQQSLAAWGLFWDAKDGLPVYYGNCMSSMQFMMQHRTPVSPEIDVGPITTDTQYRTSIWHNRRYLTQAELVFDVVNNSQQLPANIIVLVDYQHEFSIRDPMTGEKLPERLTVLENLASGAGRQIRVSLLREDEKSGIMGGSPIQNQPIAVHVLAENQFGIYHIDSKVITWTQSSEQNLLGTTQIVMNSVASEDIVPRFAWTSAEFSAQEGGYVVSIAVQNPYPFDVTAAITQELSGSAIVIDRGEGQMVSGNLQWTSVISAGSALKAPFIVTLPASEATTMTLPGAKVVLTSQHDGVLVQNEANRLVLETRWPLESEWGTLLRVAPDVASMVSVTLTNWSSSRPVDGIVRIDMTRLDETIVASVQQSIGVPILGQTATALALPAVSEKGIYRIKVLLVVNSLAVSLGSALVQVGEMAPQFVVSTTPTTGLRIGDSVTYSIVLTNSLRFPLSSISLTVSLPVSTALVSLSPGGTIASDKVSWLLGTVPAGETVKREMTLLVNPESSYTNARYLFVRAQVTAAETTSKSEQTITFIMPGIPSPTPIPQPTATPLPSATPTDLPTSLPTDTPTILPTSLPTETPMSRDTPTPMATVAPPPTPSGPNPDTERKWVFLPVVTR